MTKKLEELFDLPPSTEEEPAAVPSAENTRQTLAALDDSIDKINAALPAVRGLESSDREMDELATLAQESYKDLMDLGMQVDSRFASEIFGVASNMLGHAINVKTEDPAAGPMETGQGMVLSRNDLLERLLRGKDQNTQKE